MTVDWSRNRDLSRRSGRPGNVRHTDRDSKILGTQDGNLHPGDRSIETFLVVRVRTCPRPKGTVRRLGRTRDKEVHSLSLILVKEKCVHNTLHFGVRPRTPYRSRVTYGRDTVSPWNSGVHRGRRTYRGEGSGTGVSQVMSGDICRLGRTRTPTSPNTASVWAPSLTYTYVHTPTSHVPTSQTRTLSLSKSHLELMRVVFDIQKKTETRIEKW